MPDTWLPSLVTSTLQAGFALVVKLSRMGDDVTQPLEFETLEEPTSEQAPVVRSIDQRPEEIVTELAAAVTAS